METTHPPDAQRLYALLGDRMDQFPSRVITQLEQTLEAYERECLAAVRVPHLQLVADGRPPPPLSDADRLTAMQRRSQVLVSPGLLQGLDSIFEILHAVQLARHEGDHEGVLSEHLVEGLIVSGRALMKAAQPCHAD